MQSQYSKLDILRALQTLESIEETISQMIEWNKPINCSDDYYCSQSGMQLLTANCTLITAIGEGINRINRVLPTFLSSEFPNIPWHAIVGMRNHIAHGYFELDADIIFQSVSEDIPSLLVVVKRAIDKCKKLSADI